ncbi:hypothetical protein P8452_08091 [Trifolium repens]|nr:hypothetical protein P8452_08091 [Trifolium repens]
MASSSKTRSWKRGTKATRSSTFRTIVFPDQAKIEIPVDFKAAWFKELSYHAFAMLAHQNGNNAFLGLEVSKTKSFITGGKEAALLYGFTEPTEVTIGMEIDGEDNDIMFQFRDFPNYSEDEDMFVSDTPEYCLHPFDKDDVFGWEKTIKTTRTQVAHFPPKTAAGVVRDMKKIKIRTRHNGDNTDCTIVSYQRVPGGPVEMYMTKGWYEFFRGNNLNVGDKVQFQVSDPPYVVVLDIARNPINV